MWRIGYILILQSCIWASASFAAAESLTVQFKAALQGQPVAFDDALMTRDEVAESQARLWAAYKNAAIELGWDKTLQELGPTLEAMQAMTKEERGINKISPGKLSCDNETMPYFLVAKGTPDDNGWPLYFQMHGGGSTDKKIDNPHAWDVNSNDWLAQLRLFAASPQRDGQSHPLFPTGMYFIPRMANDNRGRWWYSHNLTAFDKVIRCSILFRNVNPNRIYMMGISEGAYGTEALTPFWADRLAGGCAMAGGAGAGERFYCLRNTAYRNETGENDTMYNRAKLAVQAHAYLDDLKKDDPDGYDHVMNLQNGRGHAIDYRPGPAWLANKKRNPRPRKICWYNFKLDNVRRTDFYWLGLSQYPQSDALIIADINKGTNTITIDAKMNPSGINESPVYAAKPPVVEKRDPLTGTDLIIYLDDQLVDLDKPVTVMLNDTQVHAQQVMRSTAVMSDSIARFGDPGRIFTGKILLKLPALTESP